MQLVLIVRGVPVDENIFLHHRYNRFLAPVWHCERLYSHANVLHVAYHILGENTYSVVYLPKYMYTITGSKETGYEYAHVYTHIMTAQCIIRTFNLHTISMRHSFTFAYFSPVLQWDQLLLSTQKNVHFSRQTCRDPCPVPLQAFFLSPNCHTSKWSYNARLQAVCSVFRLPASE